jgi:hypothetical protein
MAETVSVRAWPPAQDNRHLAIFGLDERGASSLIPIAPEDT